MPDFIQEFIDIKNFDASLVINPDSVSVQPHTSRVFGTYITSSVNFKMLTNKPYRAKTFSPLYNEDLLRFEINNEPFILYTTADYPLFSFDARIDFKNGETIDYDRAVCQETEVDEEEMTDSEIFSIYDIFYVLMNNDDFLTALSNLGYDGPFTLPTANLSMTAADLLNLVSRIEWKFRMRLDNSVFYSQALDARDLFIAGGSSTELIANLYQIPGLQDWIGGVIAISP